MGYLNLNNSLSLNRLGEIMICAGCKKQITDTRYAGEYKGKSYCKECNKKLASKLVNKLATTKKK